jgi:hypothetical protein
MAEMQILYGTNICPRLYILYSRKDAKKNKKNMYHGATENTECNYSRGFTVIMNIIEILRVSEVNLWRLDVTWMKLDVIQEYIRIIHLQKR